VIEPRNAMFVEADAVGGAEGNTVAPSRSGAIAPPGSRNDGMRACGLPRNLGDLIVSVVVSRHEGSGYNVSLEPRAVAPRAACGEAPGGTTVPPNEGNEARRDGW